MCVHQALSLFVKRRVELGVVKDTSSVEKATMAGAVQEDTKKCRYESCMGKSDVLRIRECDL